MIIPLGISGGSHDRDTCDWDGNTMIAPTGPGTTKGPVVFDKMS